MVAEIFVSEV